MPDDHLRVLSLNCWGLKYFSKNRTERIPAIAAKLANSNYDILALQELWVLTDYELIKDSVAVQLPHSRFFHSGVLGAGLAIFSRYPIVESSVHPYSLNGSPLDVAAGDWFVGKAAASVVIQHPILDLVQIFNTHFFAKGGDDGPEHQRAHRLVNAWELAKLARQAAELGRFVIAAGDFNSIPTSLPMTIIRDYAGLTDCWSITHHHTHSRASTTTEPPSVTAIRKFGITADSPNNSYSAFKHLDSHARLHFGKRLDYIFYRQPGPRYPKIPTHPRLLLKCVHANVVFTDTVPGYNFSFSDHFGLEATFEFLTDDSRDTDDYDDDDDDYDHVSSTGVAQTQTLPTLFSANLTATKQALTIYYRFSRHRSSKELAIFVICLFTLLILVISSAWLAHSWITSVVMLLAIFFSWLATTMLYQGFLYGRWELNALNNAIEDLEVYQKAVESRPGSSRQW